MVLTILRIFILYVLATAAVRIMGKRQIGELQPSELVITILLYTVDDLLTALRQKDVFDISTVGYAVLETNGKLSVMLKPDENALTAKTLQLSLPDPGMPCLVVSDGKVIREHYDDCSMNDRELKRLLRAKGLTVEDVLIMTVDRDKNAVIVEKEKKV